MNILVTGATGFIGSNLVKHLAKNKENVIYGLHRSIKNESVFNALNLDCVDNINLIYGDVNNFNVVNESIVQNEIDNIYHLAAKVIVQDAAKIPIQTINTNINGTLNVLESVRLMKRLGNKDIPTFVMSTDKVYGVSDKLPYKEDLPLNGLDIYSASKSCEDILARSYAFNYELPIVVGRPCFVKGTKILMGDGITEIDIENIKIGDEVLTHNNRVKKVINISKQIYSGNLITLTSTGLESVTCTEEHPFYSLKSKNMLCIERNDNRFCHLDNELIKYCNKHKSNFRIDKNQNTLFSYDDKYKKVEKEYFPECAKRIVPEWINASNLDLFDMTSYLIPNIKTKDIERIDIIDYIDISLIKDITHDNNFLSYGNYKSSRSIPRYIKLDNDMMTLLGYFIAEGSYLKENRKEYEKGDFNVYKGLSFKFNIKENDYIGNVVSLIIKIFGIEPYVTQEIEYNSCTVRVTNRIIANLFLTLCGEYSHNKKIHKDLMLLPNEKLKSLMSSLLNGDCWEINTGRKGLTLQSDELNRQLWDISNRLMMFPSIYVFDQKEWSEKVYCINRTYDDGRSISDHKYSDEKDKIRLAFNTGTKQRHIRYLKNNIIFSKIRNIKIEKSTETVVYNLEIEDDNSYCANRYIVHNCNTYGFDFNWTRLIPSLAKSCLSYNEKNKPLILNEGSYHYVREFNYVEDIVIVMESLIKNISKTKGQAYNVSSGFKSTTEEIVKIFFDLTYCNKEIEFKKKDVTFKEIPEQYLDSSKLMKDTKWQPKHNLISGLEKTIKKYEEWFDEEFC